MREKDIQTSIALSAILRMAAALNRTKSGATASPRIVEKKKGWKWLFDDEEWFDTHEVCIWNATQEKLSLSKLINRPIELKKAGKRD